MEIEADDQYRNVIDTIKEKFGELKIYYAVCQEGVKFEI